MGMENVKVGALVGANGGVAMLEKLANTEPLLHFLLSVGQIAVAAVTVVYIVSKTRKYLTDRRKEKARQCRKCPYRPKPATSPA